MNIYILIALIFFIFIIIITIYNGLINKKNSVKNSFSTIDVLLKKRYDLIPNLVSSIKTYMSHEKELLVNLTMLREGLSNSTSKNGERVYLENQFTSLLSSFNLKVEQYPDLKANENVIHLQQSLNEIEDQLSSGRKMYNRTVLNLNNAIEKFPSNIVAGMMSIKKRDFFEIPDYERKSILIKELF